MNKSCSSQNPTKNTQFAQELRELPEYLFLDKRFVNHTEPLHFHTWQYGIIVWILCYTFWGDHPPPAEYSDILSLDWVRFPDEYLKGDMFRPRRLKKILLELEKLNILTTKNITSSKNLFIKFTTEAGKVLDQIIINNSEGLEQLEKEVREMNDERDRFVSQLQGDSYAYN